MTKRITEMTGEEIWTAAGDMSINEAVQAYGSTMAAAKEAVLFVEEEKPTTNANEHDNVCRRVEQYLINSGES